MATPKQSSAQLPASGAAGGKKSRGVKEKHAAESAKTLTRKHVEAEQEIENPNTAAVLSQTILEEIVDDATLQLYTRLLGRKCFLFAAYSTWRFVLSNVDLCYIQCDPGDPADELQQDSTEYQQQSEQRTHEKAMQKQPQQRHRIDTTQEPQKMPQEQEQQRKSQCGLHAPKEESQQAQQEGPQEHEQSRMQLQEEWYEEQQRQEQRQRTSTALWTCEEAPQLAAIDTWAPGSLTIKSISSSTIPVSTVKKGKKWRSSNITGSNGHMRSMRKGKGQSK